MFICPQSCDYHLLTKKIISRRWTRDFTAQRKTLWLVSFGSQFWRWAFVKTSAQFVDTRLLDVSWTESDVATRPPSPPRHRHCHPVMSVLFTGKHGSSVKRARVCAVNNQACCGYTAAHRWDAWQASFSLWPHLATNWRLWWYFSLISGGIQNSLHKSHEQWQNVPKSLFILALFLLPSSILDPLRTGLLYHKTPNTRRSGKAYILLGDKTTTTKKGPFVSGRDIMFLIVSRYLVLKCFYFVSKWRCSNVRPKFNQVQDEITATIINALQYV